MFIDNPFTLFIFFRNIFLFSFLSGSRRGAEGRGSNFMYFSKIQINKKINMKRSKFYVL